MAAPKGLALYLRHFTGVRHGSPTKLAKKLADNGLKWAAIGGPWHDVTRGRTSNRWMNSAVSIHRYSEALLEAGVQPHIWGYPWHDRISQFVDDMRQCSLPGVTAGWLLDPELGLKGHPAAAEDLFRKSRAALEDMNPYCLLGFTSYGLPRGHKTFPFEAFAEPDVKGNPVIECDYGSPQLYTVPEKQIREGLEDYTKLGFDEIVPSFGCYKFTRRDRSLPCKGDNRRAIPKWPHEMEAHFVDFIDASASIEGMIGWSYNFVDKPMWEVLARWADRLDRGACSLPQSGG